MADAATIASLATAGGTLVLAIATFSATRSANRSARIAERALDLNLRPVLIPAHEWDEAERVTFHDEIVELRGGFATVEDRSGNLYFAAQLRNVGAGIGVLTSWLVEAGNDMPLSAQDWRTCRTSTASWRNNGACTCRPATSGTGRARSARATPIAATPTRSGRRSTPANASRSSCATATRTAATTPSPVTRSLPDENGDWLFGIGRHWTSVTASVALPQPA